MLTGDHGETETMLNGDVTQVSWGRVAGQRIFVVVTQF